MRVYSTAARGGVCRDAAWEFISPRVLTTYLSSYFFYYPRRKLFAGSFALVFAGVVLFLVGTTFYDCDFFRYTDGASGATIRTSIWTYMREYDGRCLDYSPGTAIDPSWMSARVFYVLGVAFGLLSAIVNLPACFTARDRVAMVIGPGLMMSAVCVGLTFLFLNSDVCRDNGGCVISTGAYLVIPAIVSYSLASIVSFGAYAEQKNEIALGMRDSVLDEPFLTDYDGDA